MSRISVIIPCYNSEKTVGETVRNIDFSKKELLELIIVDSSEADRHEKLLGVLPSEDKIRVIHLPQKSSPSVARNSGGESARGDLLLFIDSDAYPDKAWLDLIFDAYENGSRLGGGSIGLPPFQKWSGISQAQYYLQFNEFIPQLAARKVDFVPSCNLYCSKEIFDKVGGFPIIRASEDVLFCLKAKKFSSVRFIPNAIVYHIFGTGLKRLVKNQFLLGKYISYHRRTRRAGLLNNRFSLILLAPIAGLIKLGLLSLRVIKMKSIGHLAQYMYSLPFTLFGVAVWGWGFLFGSFENYGD